MNENPIADHDAPEQPARPLGLSRRDPGMQAMRRRVAPTAVPDDGIAPLDVAAFTSSI